MFAVVGVAHADPTSGVDTALFRASYDTGGIFSLEGARLMPRRDLSFKLWLGYAKSPLDISIPGVSMTPGDTSKHDVLNYVATLDMAFGMTLSDRFAIGLDVAGYRTATGAGYGIRGHYSAGVVTAPSTGLISLRPLSNIDPSANPSDASAYLGDELAGPLDARVGAKLALVRSPTFALTAIGSVFLPFGDEQMLLGDANLVFEPKLAAEWRVDPARGTRLLANFATRIRQRTVLQAYDVMDPTKSAADAKAFLDVGSELVAGLGGVYELAPRAHLAVEAQAFVPLPDAFSYGDCRLYSGKRCTTLTGTDYWPGAKHGDLTALVSGGLSIRVSSDVTASVIVGAGAGGARADQFLVTAGIAWSPQPAGAATATRGDRDGDGIPDAIDACPDDPEDRDGFQDADGCPDPDNDKDGIPDKDDKCPNDPEDKDGFQDADGCPDPDNDNDGIPDTLDKCPNDPEDFDGFEDADGCPDPDNDKDGIPDKVDKCPNDPETFNGYQDADGCPDVRPSSGGIEERADRIDLHGAQIAFGKDGKLTAEAKQLLDQVAAIVKTKKLTIRVEVHVPLGTKSTNAGQVAAQKKKDKQTAQTRAKTIQDYLVLKGVAAQQLQAVAIGSDRPLGSAGPGDAINERVDFIKAQQGAAP
jgi:outer membrane protein OmpA-like peptidoglycan-associated protein